MIIAASALFYNGVAHFFSAKITENKLTVKSNANTEKINANNKQTTGQKTRTGIFNNINNFIKASITRQVTAPNETKKNDTIKISLENYLLASSQINFPEPQSISDAIILHKQGENEAIRLVIDILKEKNKELYTIIPPLEAEKIHNNSLWVSAKFVEIMEKVSKAENDEEISKILNSPETIEIQNITNQTANDLKSLIEKYGLEPKI